MRTRLASLVALGTGALVLRLVVAHAYTAYVKPGAGVDLLLAAGVLLLTGAAGLLSPATEEHRPPPVAALLVVPLVLLVVVAPPALGSFYARHASSSAGLARTAAYPPLIAGPDGTATASLVSVVGRSLRGQDLRGTRLRLTGFVSGRDRQGRLLLTRFSVKCCAADATVSQVPLVMRGSAPDDTWLEVTGTVTTAPGALPVLQVLSSRDVEAPEDPYEA